MKTLIEIPWDRKRIGIERCEKCELAKYTYTNCMDGFGSKLASLQIFIDSPNEEADKSHKPERSRQVDFLKWLLKRNSIEEYRVDYIVRCFIPKGLITGKYDKIECLFQCRKYQGTSSNTKAIVAMGELSCLEFFAKKPGEVIETFQSIDGKRFYGCYAPGACLMSPADCVQVSRVLWKAAEFVGLKPKLNKKVLQDWDFGMF